MTSFLVRGYSLRALAMGILVLLALPAMEVQHAMAGTAPLACEDGLQESGATYRICMPAQWNQRLIVYAHGYVAPNRPVGIPEDQMTLPGSDYTVSDLITSQGYAFAASGFSVNGLAIQEGIADLVDVVSLFAAQKGTPDKVILVGVSEGGAITTLAIEQYPDVFDGGLAMCGPYGSFRDQINYFGDFRVLFDYYFPDLLPPTAIDVPASLLDNWETSYYTDTIQPAITAVTSTLQVDNLLASSGAAFDTANAATKAESIRHLLWYNVFATNDARAKLAGQPFDNQGRIYTGSTVDEDLNAQVVRYTADQTALTALAAYETSGALTRPLITLHTTGDPIVPYSHAIQYRGKTLVADNVALHEHVAVQAYGHCRFATLDILTAFNRLITLVDNPPAYQPVQRLYLPLVTR